MYVFWTVEEARVPGENPHIRRVVTQTLQKMPQAGFEPRTFSLWCDTTCRFLHESLTGKLKKQNRNLCPSCERKKKRFGWVKIDMNHFLCVFIGWLPIISIWHYRFDKCGTVLAAPPPVWLTFTLTLSLPLVTASQRDPAVIQSLIYLFTSIHLCYTRLQ